MKTLLKNSALAALLVAGFSASANATVLAWPVSAIASSSFNTAGIGSYPASDAIDTGAGSQFTDWASNGQGPGATLDMDLGAVYSLATGYVTDRVTSGGPNGAFFGGTSDFTTEFSLQVFSNSSFTTAISPLETFSKSVPGNTSDVADFLDTVNLGDIRGEFIQHTVLANTGQSNNNGLSDIHFAVPEPGTLPLLGAGLMALIGFGMFRRRKAPTA